MVAGRFITGRFITKTVTYTPVIVFNLSFSIIYDKYDSKGKNVYVIVIKKNPR